MMFEKDLGEIATRANSEWALERLLLSRNAQLPPWIRNVQIDRTCCSLNFNFQSYFPLSISHPIGLFPTNLWAIRRPMNLE